MIRKAKAVWRGTGRAGNGNLSTDSGVLANTPYSFRTRFENENGTNPEELIAAAHAGCSPWRPSQVQGGGSECPFVRAAQKNAWMPVCSRPRISAWMSWVPS